MTALLDARAVAALLHTREAGDGPLLLCLHGIGSSSASFAPQLTAFADRMRVVAWDAPGYAASPDLADPPGMDGYADLAAALITGLGHGEAVVLGMSFGGVIAARLAQRHPSLVRALVLGDSTRGSGRTPEQAAAMRERVLDAAQGRPVRCVYNVPFQIGADSDSASVVAGSPQAVLDRLGSLAALGFTSMNFMPAGPDPRGQAERLALEVLPELRKLV